MEAILERVEVPLATTEELRVHFERTRAINMRGMPAEERGAVVSRILGDGKQLVGISLTARYPNFYVVRIDSSWDIDGEDWKEQLEEIRDAIDADYRLNEAEEEEYQAENKAPVFPETDSGDDCGGCVWFPLEWPNPARADQSVTSAGTK